MEIQKSTGIVLSSKTFGESDYLVKIYTKEYGKRTFVFKGLKKSKKRSQIITEPGTIASLVYYFHEDKTLHTVNEFEISAHSSQVRDDLKKIFLLYFLVETTEKTCGFNDCNQSIFNLLAAGLDTLNNTEHAVHLSVFYLIHLLKLNGILPNFSRCRVCSRDDFQEFIIDNRDFQPVCKGCSSGSTGRSSGSPSGPSGSHHPSSGTFTFNMRIKEFFKQATTIKFSSMNYLLYPKKDLMHLLFHLCLFIEDYFHIQIKSKDLLLSELSNQ